jgi:hypothetical protein
MDILKIGALLGFCALAPGPASAQVDSNFYVFLLFGQSNMAGGGAISDSAIDCDTTARVKVMAFSDCTAGPDCKTYKMQRTHDQWYTAFPPLHDCSASLEGICPGDWFGKTMLDSVRSDVSIGLIPCALSGMALNVFLKGSSAASTVGPPQVKGQNAYNWMLNRCKLAQQKGVIKGILLHQGESGSGSSQAWDQMAMQIFNDLKADLKLDPKTPVVVGELRSDNTSPAPNNASFNTMLNGIPAKYANLAVASSKGLSGNGRDVWHFNPASMRELGRRYARGLLSLADRNFIARKGGIVGLAPKPIQANALIPPGTWGKDADLFTVDGKRKTGDAEARNLNGGSLYLIKGSNGSTLQVLGE